MIQDQQSHTHGNCVIVEGRDARRIMVSVSPLRCRTHLLLTNPDDSSYLFSKNDLPPTTNAWIHRVAEFTGRDSSYHWDTPEYRELCIEGGLNPDWRRPQFRAKDEKAAEALMIMLNSSKSGLLPMTMNFLMDIVDHIRTDPWVTPKSDEERGYERAYFVEQYTEMRDRQPSQADLIYQIVHDIFASLGPQLNKTA